MLVKREVFKSVILFLGVVLLSGTPFVTIYTGINNLIFLLLVFLLPELISMLKIRVKRSFVIYFIFSCSIFITGSIYFELNKLFYWRLFSLITVAFVISNKYSFECFKKVFLEFMYYETIVSLVGYSLVKYTTLLNILPKISNINNQEYVIGIVFNYISHIPDRNCGIFWEPGIFASYLSIAIVFEAIYNKNPRWKRIIILFLGLFSAHSSAGYVLGGFSFLVILLRKNSKNSILKNLFAFILGTSAIFFIFNLDKIILSTSLSENEYVIKLLSSNILSSTRVRAFLYNLESFKENVFFGNGLKIFEGIDIPFFDMSTSTYVLNIFGFFGIVYFFAWVYGIFKQKEINFYIKIILLIIIMIILNKEPHLNMLFTWCLLFFLINKRKIIYKEKNGFKEKNNF